MSNTEDEFTTIYFVDTYNVDQIDIWMLNELFYPEISLGSNYINIHTLDRSVIGSVIDELGRDNISEVSYG